jgi:transposase
MKIVGCDLHARQQSVAMLDTDTGELIERKLEHEGGQLREFYTALQGPVVVGIEATGAMQWFVELLEELGIECQVGHPAKIRAADTRHQKHDRRDAQLLMQLMVEKRFPQLWIPGSQQRDLRALLRDRHHPRIVGQLANGDFIRLANSRFLDFIVEYCCDKNTAVTDLMVAYGAVELYDRWLKLMHQSYDKARVAYKTEIFTFVVPGAKQHSYNSSIRYCKIE